MGNLDPPVFFGEWLKLQRRKLDLTQDELALRMGCSIFALRKIESGERRPSKQLAGLLAKALDIPRDQQETFTRVARGELRIERLPAQLAINTPVHASASSTPTPPTHLPMPPTPLVGRETDLAAMARIFHTPHCRLLTVTGMGGVGKTRLAIEFAARQANVFPNRIFYIPLTSLSSAGLIVPAIADALGYNFSGTNEPKEQLFHYLSSLGSHPLLLVFDNMEHLLAPPAEAPTEPGAAHLIAELLQHLPALKLVITSRERLNLSGEWTYELHGLPVPPGEYSNCLEDYSSTILFIQSAKRAQAIFELKPGDQIAIAEICRYVEGIPLAIELAAAWVSVLSVEEITRELHSSLDLLTTSLRDIPERHRSIQATFDHSWKLLQESEQQALCKLAIFQDVFDRQAADYVAGATLPVLASLVSKSLVQKAGEGGYSLHEAIRQSSYSHLTANPQFSPTRDRHSVYFLSLVQKQEKALKSDAQQTALRELLDRMDDIRAAWAWAIERQHLTKIDAAIRCLGWFFETAGLLQEGIDLFAQLIQAFPDAPPGSLPPIQEQVLGKALGQQGLLYFRKGQFSRARAGLEKSLQLLRPLGNPALLVDTLIYLGVIKHLDGEINRSVELINECLQAADQCGDAWFTAYAIYNLGYIDSLQGHYSEAITQMLAGLEIWRKLGDPHSISLGLNYLAPTMIILGRFNEVDTNMEESIRLSSLTGNRWGKGVAYRFSGLAHLARGNLTEAHVNLHKSLETFRGYITGLDLALSLLYLAKVHQQSGEFEQAAGIYCDSLRSALDANSIPLQLDAILGLAEIQAETGESERAIQLAATIQNHSLSSLEAKTGAQKLLESIENQLTPGQCQNARHLAERRPLRGLIEELLRNSRPSPHWGNRDSQTVIPDKPGYN